MSLEDINSVLIEYDDTQNVHTSCGICFQNRYILAPSNIFLTILHTTENIKKWIVAKEFRKLHPISIPETEEKIRVLTNKESTSKAEMVAVFYCKNIFNSTPKVLSEWCLDINDTNKQLKEALSLFVLLEIKFVSETKSDYLNLEGALYQLLLQTQRSKVKRGSKICTESTPFGNRSFFNSYSAGIISNIIGKNDCFLLIDAPTVPGSEGGAVFRMQKDIETTKYPIGIILASLTWWRGEYVGLSLCAKLNPLLAQLFYDRNATLIERHISNNAIFTNSTKSIMDVFNNKEDRTFSSFVQIFCGSSWGTGIVLNSQKGIIITNSHVTLNDNLYEVAIHIKDEIISCDVLYKTPDAMIFDIAILKCNPMILEKFHLENIKTANTPAHKGEEVLSVGFPFFRQTVSTCPTLSCGHVSFVNESILKTTCSIHPGSSGGGILRLNGELLGIIVCNTRLTDSAAISNVYPNVNMAIPWLAIRDVFQEYFTNENVSIFKKLCKVEDEFIKEWSLQPPIASKL